MSWKIALFHLPARKCPYLRGENLGIKCIGGSTAKTITKTPLDQNLLIYTFRDKIKHNSLAFLTKMKRQGNSIPEWQTHSSEPSYTISAYSYNVIIFSSDLNCFIHLLLQFIKTFVSLSAFEKNLRKCKLLQLSNLCIIHSLEEVKYVRKEHFWALESQGSWVSYCSKVGVGV